MSTEKSKLQTASRLANGEVLHICFNSDHYPQVGGRTGGIGVFVQTLGRMLVSRGCKVTVVGAGYKQDSIDDDEGVQVIRIAKSKWPVGKFVQQIWRINAAIKKAHKQSPIHILECSEVGLALIKKISGVKNIIRMHGGHHFFIHAQHMKLVPKTVWQEKRSFEKTDALCAVSRYVNEETSKYLGFDAGKTTILYNGVLPAKLQLLAGDATTISGKIVFVGTICEKKGARQLVQSFAAVKKEVPHAELFMAGPDWFFPDGTSYTFYLQQYIPAELASSIHLMGALSNTEVPALIASAEVCVYPSHMEAMPMAWLEAMSVGKPVVASITGPGKELIDHEIDGLLCDPYSPESIASNLVRFLKNSAFAKQCGERAQQKVIKHFDMEKLVDENIAFYEKVLGL